MSNPMTPIHLEGYDVFATMAEWVAKSPERKREAFIRTMQFGNHLSFQAELRWRDGEQRYSILKVDPSAPQAVYLAFLEFERANCDGAHA